MTDIALRLALGLTLLIVTLAVRGATVNRLVKRKLRLPALLFVVYLVVAAVIAYGALTPEMSVQLVSLNRMLLALAAITLLVVVGVNSLRVDRVPDRVPSIVQDALIIGLFLVAGTVMMREKFLTTSAVGAVVVGFALQDTLGNMFAGLAIQVEKPFHVGHWVTVGSHEGRVHEVTWRATKLKTKTGNLIILPNSLVAKEPIVNYSEPEVPARFEVDIGVSYQVPPNQVRAALVEAARGVPSVLTDPAPEVIVHDFAASAVSYRVLIWTTDFARSALTCSRVRTAAYYALRRHRYEIPYPIQIEYQRTEKVERPGDRRTRVEDVLGEVDLFAPLTPEERGELAAHASELLYGAGDTIVRSGEAGDSMFVVARGAVRVVDPSGNDVARLGERQYFGEMSLLTGRPRSASVVADGDCEVVELTAASLRAFALGNPKALSRISEVVVLRQVDLDQKIAARTAAAATAETPQSLLARIRTFLGLADLLG